jgi:hypothetical protein
MKPSRQIKPIGYPIAAIGKAADASPPSIHLALETTPLWDHIVSRGMGGFDDIPHSTQRYRLMGIFPSSANR